MRSFFFRLLPIILVIIPRTIIACEGECIVGITNVWVSNHTAVVLDVLPRCADEIFSELRLTPSPSPPPHVILNPIFEAYRERAYAALKQAIFPGFFHGRCQNAEGVDPPGCPNPDCPVVCGTPGSLVHFFPKLRFIAFDETRKLLKEAGTPGSVTFEEVVKNVQQQVEAGRQRERRGGIGRRGLSIREAMVQRADENEIREVVGRVLGQLPEMMRKACGGTGDGKTNGLPNCSWRDRMEPYILSFP